MTCKDCLHYEVCKHHDAVVDFPVDDGVCRFFEDRTKWVEQKHGRWELEGYQSSPFRVVKLYRCSICGMPADYEIITRCCPNCGALMDEGRRDDE